MWPFKKKPKGSTYSRAAGEGVVTEVRTGFVSIEYDNGATSEHFLLKATLVQPGQPVKAGQPVGKL